jgi:acyl-CoA synthetase (AMP-forming)/AMP-acid ligase II
VTTQDLPPKAKGPTALHLIRNRALSGGQLPALIIPTAWCDGVVSTREEISFEKLWQRTSDLARGLSARGFREHDRVLVAAPLSTDVYAFLLALFTQGLSAVFIDTTNRSPRTVRAALAIAKPRAVLGTPKLLRYRMFIPALWGAQAFVVNGKTFGAHTLDSLALPGPPVEPLLLSPDAESMVAFTSGSTGRPKGVVRTHETSLGQHHGLSQVAELGPGDVHLTSLPVVAFHNLMSGACTVLPARDPLRRDGTDSSAVVSQLLDEKVTHLSGAPAFIEEVADELLRRRLRVDSLRSVLTGAAPVGAKLARKLSRAFEGAEVRILYGSTEAEPMTSIPARLVGERVGRGYLVGRPAPVGEVRVVSLGDGPVQPGTLDVRAHSLEPGIEGEIIVAGPQVVERYLNDPESEARLKIRDVADTLWHRTLDVGFFDENGELWLTGRVPDQIPLAQGQVAPLPVEAALDSTPGVRRSALIVHARAPRGEALIELEANANGALVTRACETVLREHGLHDIAVVLVPEIPVDPRHFSKLDRPTLRSLRGAA